MHWSRQSRLPITNSSTPSMKHDATLSLAPGGARGKDGAGYSSPALLEVGGRKQVVVFTGGSAIGLAVHHRFSGDTGGGPRGVVVGLVLSALLAGAATQTRSIRVSPRTE